MSPKKSARQFLAIVALAIAASTLSSCVYLDDYGPPYSSYHRAPSSTTYHTSSFGYGGRSYYGGRPYYGGRYYDYHRGHGHYHKSHHDDRIKLTGGSQKGKPNRPTGYHSRDWYEKRGYNLSNYKHKHEKSGKTHEGKNYRKKKR